ncbi:hypothetical protein DAEQUDRAFT_726513 [Daedalea quercina L-15889]|uniref:F-box domain-containing protein n=1 Tax=Daedalea quercina L-15889 TaxID=1314783 RepID=A0A165QJ79_9APHY|nr:hypothetical protein DAEQUDRAFT_726513 [Daedalea quercina L-15889]
MTAADGSNCVLPIADLPLELHEQILYQLVDDKTALAQCSLTCRTWAPMARRHLFESVTFSWKGPCMQALDILEMSLSVGTYLAHHVRSITLPSVWLGSGERRRERLDLLRRLMRSLPHAESLRVPHPFDWHSFIEGLQDDAGQPVDDIRDRMQAFFPFPKLEILHLENTFFRSAEDLRVLLSVFPRLSVLKLDRVTFDDELSGRTVTPARVLQGVNGTIHIRKLTVHSEGSCLAVLLDALSRAPFDLSLCELNLPTTETNPSKANATTTTAATTQTP